MAYATSNQPYCMTPGVIGTGPIRLWGYGSTHTLAELTTAGGFVTDGKALGMKVGDYLFMNSTAAAHGICKVTAVSSTGATLAAYAT